MTFPLDAVAAIAVPAVGGVLWAYHNLDKRLDRVEAELRLTTYRLESLEADLERRGGRLKQAIYEITQWLQKRGFTPRSVTTDGPWPTGNPPTGAVYVPRSD